MSIDYKKYLSANFQLIEFCRSACTPGEIDVQPDKYQIYLVKELCIRCLQPTRDHFGKSAIITSGMRNKRIINAMIAKGYKPSRTTDHAYLDPDVYQWGVGAADFHIQGVDILDVYKWMVKQSKIRDTFQIGQLILYVNHKFIHVSNPVTTVFSIPFAHEVLRKKNKYLKCSGYSNYKIVEVDDDGEIIVL